MSAQIRTIYNDCLEPYLNYGLQHFMRKYGFSCTDNPRQADAFVGYSSPGYGNFKVQIILNSATRDRISQLNIKGENIPIFKQPAATSGTNPIMRAIVGNEDYGCLSLNGNQIMVGFDVFSEIGRILAGCYDNYFLKKDKLGMLLRSVPVVDVLEDAIISAIIKIAPDMDTNLSPIWPERHKFALALTHDVDRVYKTYQYLPSILKSIKKCKPGETAYHLKNILFKHSKNNPYWMFERIIELENSLGVKSTYYFLNEKGKINPFILSSWIYYAGRYNIESSAIQDSIQKLKSSGFEIGVHGSYNSYNNKNLLMQEKNTLESITGIKTTGIRQHYLNYDTSTSSIHNQCGFHYDTTIGYKPGAGIGFRRGTSFPFQVMLPDMTVLPLVEIPLIIMDSALDSVWPREECFKLIEQVEKYHGVLTILWHTNIFNSREYPDMADLYKQIITESKSRGAWVSRACDIYTWLAKSPYIISSKILTRI